MCTVTFIPTEKSGFVLTSNRDEAPNRKTLKPDFYTIEDTKMLFPKDELAGGTWIGLSNKNRLVCLLNGGFTLHERQAKYRMSRGIVVKNILASDDIVASIEDYNLKDIEPFTIVLVDWNSDLKLFELVWDGTDKHFSKLPLEPKLWSSSTLYNAKMKTERQNWFQNYLKNNGLTAESILDFHQHTENNNENYGVIMDRGFVKTTSITQVVKSPEDVIMSFNNLQSKTISKINFETPEIVNE